MGYPILPRHSKRSYRGPNSSDDSRTTSQSIRFEKFTWEDRTALPSGTHFITESKSNTSVGAVATKSFQRNKDWKEIVARGGDATYPYSVTKGEVVPLRYNGRSRSTTTDVVYRGNTFGSTLIDQTDILNLRDQALVRLKNKLNGHIGSAQLLGAAFELRELHKTFRGITELTGSTLEQGIAAKRASGGKNQKWLKKYLGSIWLAYSFGVKPLLGDVLKAADAIESYKNRKDQRVKVTGSASRDWTSQDSIKNSITVGTGSTYLQLVDCASHRMSYRYIAVADLKIFSDNNYMLADHLGLNLAGLPAALWEITAFSWVIDYFSTVGPWLEDVFYTLPGNLVYCCLNTRYNLETRCEGYLERGTPSYTVAGHVTPGFFRYVSFQRAKLASLPYRGLRLREADEVGMHALNKVLNLVAVYASISS